MLLWALKYGNLLILQKKPMYVVHILIKSVQMPRNTAHGYSEHSVQETKLLYSHFGKLLYSPDYCSQLWSPHKINEIEILEGIARSFTCRISEAMHLDLGTTKSLRSHVTTKAKRTVPDYIRVENP